MYLPNPPTHLLLAYLLVYQAESRLMRLVVNRMDSQDKAILGAQGKGFVSRVLSVGDDEEEE